jgi:hypothetical protein
MNETYTYSVTCETCKASQDLQLVKRDAAFWLLPHIDKTEGKCIQCNGTNFSSSLQMPKLDSELILEWASHKELYLLDQDEELILAEMEYVPTMLKILDEQLGLPSKRDVIIDALCVIVYDNLHSENEARERLAAIVVAELIKRKHMVIASRDAIMDYIKEVVFPRLEIPIS